MGLIKLIGFVLRGDRRVQSLQSRSVQDHELTEYGSLPQAADCPKDSENKNYAWDLLENNQFQRLMKYLKDQVPRPHKNFVEVINMLGRINSFYRRYPQGSKHERNSNYTLEENRIRCSLAELLIRLGY